MLNADEAWAKHHSVIEKATWQARTELPGRIVIPSWAMRLIFKTTWNLALEEVARRAHELSQPRQHNLL